MRGSSRLSIEITGMSSSGNRTVQLKVTTPYTGVKMGKTISGPPVGDRGECFSRGFDRDVDRLFIMRQRDEQRLKLRRRQVDAVVQHRVEEGGEGLGIAGGGFGKVSDVRA